MKKLILFYFILLSASAFSQDYDSPSQSQPVLVTFKTYGYIKGKRPDSIDAQYGEFDLRTIQIIWEFHYCFQQRARHSCSIFFILTDGTRFKPTLAQVRPATYCRRTKLVAAN